MSERELIERLDRIEQTLGYLVGHAVGSPAGRPNRAGELLTVKEAGKLLKRAPYTIREWITRGRIRATKSKLPNGQYSNWLITTEEVDRITREGLLPEGTARNGRA